ncbi:MAG: hypothetical protein JWM21_4137 [Acidobacteria bacterium]|nr:hypothetical protein [Acidobacteriota bacterium]
MKSEMSSFKNLAGWLTAGFFAVSLAIPTLAQGTPTGPPPGAGPPPDINPRREDLVRRTNEARMRSLEMEGGAEVENQKRIQAAIVNMKQDFTRIQVLRNDIARNLIAHKPLDYSLIAEQTGEINKRAHRLNVYMLAHASDDKEPANPSDLKDDEMTGALVRLCKLIDSFTENPALKNAATIEAKEIQKAKEQKSRADKDLLTIMKLSESIQKKSDSLKGP